MHNKFSTEWSMVLGASIIPFLWNIYYTARYGKKVTVDDPWGFGGSHEWATSCPPPRHNFHALPRIRSERPALDLHHPELLPLERRKKVATKPRTQQRESANLGKGA